MANDFILDMETLGTESNAIILSIGCLACPDDPAKLRSNLDIKQISFYAKLGIGIQKRLGRTMEKSTLEWWQSQGEEAKSVLSKENRENPFQVIQNLNDFLTNFMMEKESIIWTRGLIDMMWLQSLCKDLKIDCPIDWWKARDIRTVCDIIGGEPSPEIIIPENIHIVKHNPISDCVLDYFRLQKIFS